MKVLIVDDEQELRSVARLGLELMGGMTCVEAASGEEALTAAAKERPDVVLLDMIMPGMDGGATLRRLRENPSTADIPVVLLTAALPAELQSLRALGVLDVIVKPFDPRKLASNLRMIMRSAGRMEDSPS